MLLDEIKNIKGSAHDLKNFGLVVGGVLFGMGLGLLYFSRGSWIFWTALGGFLFASGLIAPKLLRPIYKLWMAFGTVMGFIMTNVILTVFFYLVLTPLAIILKSSGKHFLDLGVERGQKSYWNRRKEKSAAENLDKQF